MNETTPRAPLDPYYRWLVLGFMSLICFAQYYVYDSITPLASMIKSELGFSGADYGLLFTFYAVANVLGLLLVAGVLVDRLGLKWSGILYGVLCVAGAAVTAVGATLPPDTRLPVMLLGRAIYGVGAESILIVNNKVLARWFGGKELAFAYGLNLFVMRLGTFLALILQAPVAESWGLQSALWFAAAVMAIGLGTFFFYLLLERAAQGRAGAPAAIGSGAGEERFVLKEAFSFKPSFWLITALCVCFYSAVFPFQSYAPDILTQKFGYGAGLAGRITSALVLGTMIFTPIIGLFVDRKGRRATLMLAGSLLLVPCHLLLGYTRFPPVVPIFVVGVALSLVPAALWAAIPRMVPERRLGTAFGVVGYVQNVGLMLFPWLAGLIADAHTVTVTVDGKQTSQVDYTSTMLLFASLGVVGFVCALLLKRADRREGGVLERPSGDAAAAGSDPAAPASI